jgi:FtsH-binding integral membrane protein
VAASRALLKRSIFTILLLGVLTTLGFMVHAGEPSSPSWWLLFVPFAGWVSVPYAVVALAVRRQPVVRSSQVVLLIAAIALATFGGYTLYGAFVTHIDAQSGIVFVFLPLYQLVGLVPLLWIAQSLARRGAAA